MPELYQYNNVKHLPFQGSWWYWGDGRGGVKWRIAKVWACLGIIGPPRFEDAHFHVECDGVYRSLDVMDGLWSGPIVMPEAVPDAS